MQTLNQYRFPGLHTDGKNIFTKNLTPGRSVYGEKLIVADGVEYRHWNPYRSKLAALVLKGCRHFPFARDSKVLYLGAASGTTVSHISDIAVNGAIYAVEISPRAIRDLIRLAERRKNIIPILADANKPLSYRAMVPASVDVLYQDVAQRNQLEIFLNNAEIYLGFGGYGLLMVKARSIDVTKTPEKLFSHVEAELNKKSMKILAKHNLEPFDKDHMAIVVKPLQNQ